MCIVHVCIVHGHGHVHVLDVRTHIGHGHIECMDTCMHLELCMPRQERGRVHAHRQCMCTRVDGASSVTSAHVRNEI